MKAGTLEWTQIIVTALITAIFSIVVGIILFHYSNRTPDLLYEIFSPASFSNGSVQFGIYSSTLKNYGDKEAEDVQFLISLSKGTSFQDMKVEPTSPAISYSVNKKLPESVEIFFPRLNPEEGAKFTMLLDKTETGIESISVRGNGINGKMGVPERSVTESIAVYAVSVIVGVITAFASSFLVIRFLGLNLGEAFRSQKKLADEELKIVRMRGAENINIKNLLLSNKFRLYFNPKAQKFKYMKFGENGVILDGKNQNENRWAIKRNFLELIDENGLTHSRFYYSPVDNAFYHTNDPDTGSITKHNIRDQCMIVEE